MNNTHLYAVRNIVLTILGVVFVSALAAQAQTVTRSVSIAVEGAKQGIFVTDSPKSKIQALGVSYEVKPGQPGRGQLHSLVVTKEAGVSSTQFFAAFFNNEMLKTVILEFHRLAANGTDEIYQTIKLTNATVAHLKQYTKLGDQAKGQAPLLEDITLAFQHVEISSLGSKTVAADELK
ncbi:MAG: type VI secretion system tube protein Hcp [Pyrinomonadaceae bacterium]